LLLDRIILPKPTLIFCLLLAVKTAVLSQSIDPRLLQQSQAGQTQENSSSPNLGPMQNLQRQIRPDPTQITNVPPGQEILDQQREMQNQMLMNLQPLPPLPPEPDIEFQEFVASSLGYSLNVFGHDLFEDVPSTFAPLDRVPVTPDYLIGPGDE
jgi:hypothetical protein